MVDQIWMGIRPVLQIGGVNHAFLVLVKNGNIVASSSAYTESEGPLW
jgi:hypothetical protein